MFKDIALLVVMMTFVGLLSGCQIFFPSTKRSNTQTTKRSTVDPANSGILLKRAMQDQETGNLDQALATFIKILESDPDNFDAHMGVGDIYHVKGDFNAAAKTFENARKINPRDFNVNYKLGLMYHLLDRLKDAVQIYLTALSINPESYEANLNLATAYLQMDQPALGLPYAQKAVKLNPKTMVSHANLGAIYSAVGRYDEAIESYRNAAEWGELETHVVMGLVDAFIKTGKFTRAINTLKLLNQRAPSPSTNERLGYVYFKLGQFDESLAAYQAANKLDPNNTAALNGMGVNLMTKYLQGERNDKALKRRAIEAWQKSIKLDATQKRIIDLISRYREL